jgi:hypothetical protein
MCFLEEQRALENDQHLTCDDIRRKLQHQHCWSLLQRLLDCFSDGCSLDQISTQLVLSISKSAKLVQNP